MSRRSRQIEMAFQHGQHLHGVGRLAEAEQVYRQILAATPAHADSLHMLGVMALQAGQPQDALAWVDRAIASRPVAAAYHVTRASALLALRQFDAAIAACRTALRHKRNSSEAFQTMGHALLDVGRGEEAVDAYSNASRLNPALPDLLNNFGTALRTVGRLEEARTRLEEARQRTPLDTGVLVNLSGVLKELGHFAEAGACMEAALRLRPNDPVLLYNQGILELLTGSINTGWQGFEYRFRAGAVAPRGLAQPQWLGEPLADRTLLVHCEQGLGDTIQFCRYLPLAAARGFVVCEVPGPLRRLLDGLQGAPPLVSAGDSLPKYDAVCPLMSLPLRLGTPVEATAGLVPYLSADPGSVARWRARIGAHGIRVGIAWQGNPHRVEDRGRSVQLDRFRPLAQVPGVRLISLQKGAGSEQLAAAPWVESLGDDLDAGSDAFVDSAAVMMSLDLVISTDTAVAHLAGALGRPVWVALRLVPDWRWMLKRDDSPWYPTMRLFRQTEREQWDPVFAAMAVELAGGRNG